MDLQYPEQSKINSICQNIIINQYLNKPILIFV